MLFGGKNGSTTPFFRRTDVLASKGLENWPKDHRMGMKQTQDPSFLGETIQDHNSGPTLSPKRATLTDVQNELFQGCRLTGGPNLDFY